MSGTLRSVESPRPRRATRAQPAPITVRGDRGLGEHLTHALAAAAAEPEDALTHGFHAYPARMHPGIAARLMAQLGGPRTTVLDPFCGSGTVLLEAMLSGAQSVGVDLNPVALRIAAVRCERRRDAERERFARALERVCEASRGRVAARTAIHAPIPADHLPFYDPHVLKELGGLWAEIETVEPLADRRALLVVLSAIVVKFSRRRAETSQATIAKRIGKGVPTSFFGRKGAELIGRWQDLDRALEAAPEVHAPKLHGADARELGRTLSRRRTIDAVVSSPPYGGTYDYVEHHALREPWLGVAAKSLRRHELGARRDLAHGSDAEARWDRQIEATLRSIAEVLSPAGVCVLLMGDGDVGGRRIDAARQLRRLAPNVGMEALAAASSERVDWRGGADRCEHLVWLVRSR